MTDYRGPMGFGSAVAMAESGLKISREGWNGKGMYLFHVSNWLLFGPYYEGQDLLPFIAMKTADNKIVPWLASQTDILAKDWYIV